MYVRRVEPGPGQESVWDYPRPPRLEDCDKTIKVVCGGQIIATSNHSKRVLETSHPPVYYLPPEDVRLDFLVKSSKQTYCEWKGTACYLDIVFEASRIDSAAWTYPSPTPRFASLQNHLAFYPHLMDACFVNGERVFAQKGNFYGGWITSDIVGPFKGEPGSIGW